jgi:hypothetical protein
MRLTATQAINRGYNLMVAAFLLSAGLAFGTVGFAENDIADKIDDFGLLIVGLTAVVWYLAGRGRFSRSGGTRSRRSRLRVPGSRRSARAR